MNDSNPTPCELVRKWKIAPDSPQPMGRMTCHVCLDGEAVRGLVCARCYESARDAADQDAGDEYPASIDAIAEELERMAQRTRESTRHRPGEHDPIPWALAELPLRRRETTRVCEFGHVGGVR